MIGPIDQIFENRNTLNDLEANILNIKRNIINFTLNIKNLHGKKIN